MNTSRKRGHFIIFERDNFRCVYCGVSRQTDSEVELTVDHILPVKRGGSDHADNLVTACENCNSQKQDRLMSDELISSFVAMAQRRNLAAGVPNHQIIALKSTSSTKRSRREWDALTFRVMKILEDIIWFDPASFSLDRARTIVDIFCLTIQALTEYTRITGDLQSANEARALLRRMAVDACVAQIRSLPGVTQEPNRESQDDYVASKLEALDHSVVELWMGSYGIATLLEWFLLTGRAKPDEISLFGKRHVDLDESDMGRLLEIWQEEREYRRSYERSKGIGR